MVYLILIICVHIFPTNELREFSIISDSLERMTIHYQLTKVSFLLIL